MIERLLLEEELRQSGIVTTGSQIGELADLIMDLLSRGLLGKGFPNSAAQSSNNNLPQVPCGRQIYCQPCYNGDSTQRKFLVRFADAEVVDRTFDNETEARAFFEAAIDNWNCYLFGLLER